MLIWKKNQKGKAFLYGFFSFRGENWVSILACEQFGDLSGFLYHNGAVHGVHGTNANLKQTHPANFMQDFKSPDI